MEIVKYEKLIDVLMVNEALVFLNVDEPAEWETAIVSHMIEYDIVPVDFQFQNAFITKRDADHWDLVFMLPENKDNLDLLKLKKWKDLVSPENELSDEYVDAIMSGDDDYHVESNDLNRIEWLSDYVEKYAQDHNQLIMSSEA